MMEEIIIAGFGGQGVMSMGQLLAYAGMKENKHVSWLPSYGPEQRGGTANASVVISSDEVGSPVIDRPSTLIALNTPSLKKFEHSVKKNGNIFINADLIHETTERDDIQFFPIKANTMAHKLKNDRVAGMIILGAFIEKTGILNVNSLVNALLQVLGKDKKHLVPVNEKAINLGREWISKQTTMTT